MKTLTITENKTYASTISKATHTVAVTSGNYSNALGSQTLVLPVPSIKVKYNTNSGGRNMISDDFDVTFTNISMVKECSCSTGLKSLAYNTYFEIPKSRSSWTVNMSELFNSSNPTVRTVPLNWKIQAYPSFIITGKKISGGAMETVGERNTGFTGTITGEGSITLNAPPTFDNTSISFNTQSIYTDITTASVSVSNLTAMYDGNITDVEFKIGNQTANRSDAGTLSIVLDTVGTFIPTITVTDSRGQTSTVTLDAITVLGYTAPSLNFAVERTGEDGKPNDEGDSAVVTARFVWTSALTGLEEPTIDLVDEADVPVQGHVEWYTQRNQNGTLTGLISDFTQLTPSDMPIYALITSGTAGQGLFDTQLSYQISITPEDEIGGGSTIDQTLGGAFYTVDFLAGGHGIAFGQPARNEGFECAMQASFADKGNVMTALVDLIHPVGSYYWTSDGDFVPADVFGGSWEQIDAGVTLVSAGTGYTVSSGTAKDGGNPTATLEIANMPAHNHGEKSLTGYVTLRKTGAGYNTAVSRSGIVSSISDSGSGTSVNGSGSTGQKLDQVNFNATHTHDTQGSGTAFDIMNPYKCAYCWHRIG